MHTHSPCVLCTALRVENSICSFFVRVCCFICTRARCTTTSAAQPHSPDDVIYTLNMTEYL